MLTWPASASVAAEAANKSKDPETGATDGSDSMICIYPKDRLRLRVLEFRVWKFWV